MHKNTSSRCHIIMSFSTSGAFSFALIYVLFAYTRSQTLLAVNTLDFDNCTDYNNSNFECHITVSVIVDGRNSSLLSATVKDGESTHTQTIKDSLGVEYFVFHPRRTNTYDLLIEGGDTERHISLTFYDPRQLRVIVFHNESECACFSVNKKQYERHGVANSAYEQYSACKLTCTYHTPTTTPPPPTTANSSNGPGSA